MRFKILLTTLALGLLGSSCGNHDEASFLDAVAQDSLMKVVKVPLPENFFQFPEKTFPSVVPLVISSKDTTAEQLGYWVLCADAAGEKKIIEGLGIDYSKYTGIKNPAISSADVYNPSSDPTERKNQQDHYCKSTILAEKALCALYKLAPESQAPLICPGSLDKVDGEYTVQALTTGPETIIRYSNGLADLKAINIGCREVKPALIPSNVQEITIIPSQKPSEISDLNCLNGHSPAPVVETFESICEDARAGKAPDDRKTLDALITRVGLQGNLTCAEIKKALDNKLATGKTEDKAWNLTKSNIASLKLLSYFNPLEQLNLSSNQLTGLGPIANLANLRVLNLADNPELGGTDTETQSILQPLKGLGLLTNVTLTGTKVQNIAPLNDLAFLADDGVKAVWQKILPATCSPTATSAGLQKTCAALRSPIQLSFEGNAATEFTRFVVNASEIDYTFVAKHSLLSSADAAQVVLSSGSRTTCAVKVEGLRVSSDQLPTESCTIEVIGTLGTLKTVSTIINVKRLSTCDGHTAGTQWTETFPDRSVKFGCQRQGNEAVKKIESGSCNSQLEDFVNTGLPKGNCALVRCPGPHNVGDDWTIGTTDSLGSYGQQCLTVDGKPTVAFKPNSGKCNDAARYDFDVNKKACVLVRCSNGKTLGSTWFDTADGLTNGLRQYACINGDIVPQPVVSCSGGYLERSGQCKLACDSQHAVGDSAWPIDHGTSQCSGSSIIVASCDSGYLARGLSCKATCDGTHTDGEAWSSSHGNYKCSGATIVLNSCEGGYLARGQSCSITCDGSHVAGESWGEGNGTYACQGGSKVLAGCNSGYTASGSSCIRTCSDGHTEGQTWSVGVRHGSQDYSCSGGSINAGGISCESGFSQNGGGCYRSCAGASEGGSWTVNQNNGTFEITCNEPGPSDPKVKSCNTGYKISGNACVKTGGNPPPHCIPPPGKNFCD